MRTLTTYADARDAFRSHNLRQALYDEGEHLMAGVIVNLHGREHVDRRRLENRLFRPDVFAWYEAERIPAIVGPIVEQARGQGGADLVPLALTTMLTLSAEVAGIDVPDDDLAALHALGQQMARAATVAHATGGKAAIVADGDRALQQFADAFYAPSLARRRALVEWYERGALAESELPRDVLTTLLRNQERLELPPATMLREGAYYPWVGSHSTTNAFVHALHHVFDWLATRPGDHALLADDTVRQRFAHESLRLHPASPVAVRVATADVVLRSGATIHAGERVVIDVDTANRDPDAFGPWPERFDPARQLSDGVAPWGLSFGHGPHSCLGQELAGGRVPADDGVRLSGAIVVMSGAVLAAGARPDPDDPPVLDAGTTRHVWARYPVRFG